jgi:hypothetical protein
LSSLDTVSPPNVAHPVMASGWVKREPNQIYHAGRSQFQVSSLLAAPGSFSEMFLNVIVLPSSEISVS